METRFKNSFIPKKPIQVGTGMQAPRKRGGKSFFTLLSVVLFSVAIGGTVGMFMWKLAIEKTIAGQIATLKKDRDSLDSEFISKATKLNQRIIAANRLIEKHVAPSIVFNLLEDTTLKTVQFVQFQFVDGEDGLVKVVSEGIGDKFTSIVLQSDEFGKTGELRDVIFSDLQPTEDNDVNFRFEATIDPRLLLYSRSVLNTPIDEGDGNSGSSDVNDVTTFE